VRLFNARLAQKFLKLEGMGLEVPGIASRREKFISEKQFVTHTTVRPIWDLDEMVDKVSRSLHEDVDPLMVRQVLIDVLADYEDARILTFVPILACRGAEEKLRKKE